MDSLRFIHAADLHLARPGPPVTEREVRPRVHHQLGVEADAVEHLHYIAEQNRFSIHVLHELSYATVSQCARTYPTVEEYYVAAPALVQTKARNGVADFDDDWMSMGDLYCGQDDIPNLFANV